MRDVPTTITSVLGAVTNRPVELFEFYLDDETLCYAASDANITYAGSVYLALGLERDAIKTSLDLAVDELGIKLDNVNLAMASQIIATDFVSRRARVQKLFLDAPNSGNATVLFDGRMDEPTLDQKALSVKVRSWLDGLHRHVPVRLYGTLCNYRHYDTYCQVDRTSSLNVATGTVLSMNSAYLLDSSVFTLTAAGYWGPIGTLTFLTGSNRAIGREIIAHTPSSRTIEVRIPFPFSVASGDQFEVARGCRKNAADCMSKFSNWVNYGGYTTIPTQPVHFPQPLIEPGGGGGGKG